MLLKIGGSSFQQEEKPQDGVDTVDSPTCLSSGFTENDWKIYMDTGVVQLYDSLEAHKTDSDEINRNIFRNGSDLKIYYAFLT